MRAPATCSSCWRWTVPTLDAGAGPGAAQPGRAAAQPRETPTSNSCWSAASRPRWTAGSGARPLELAQADARAACSASGWRWRVTLRSWNRWQRPVHLVAQVQTPGAKGAGAAVAAQALERQRAGLGRERGAHRRRRQLPMAARNAQGGIRRDLAALWRAAAEQDAARQVVIRARGTAP